MIVRKPAQLAELAALGAVTSVPRAGDFFGLSRPQSYALERQGAFPVPVHRVGQRRYVLVTELAHALGFPPEKLLAATE